MCIDTTQRQLHISVCWLHKAKHLVTCLLFLIVWKCDFYSQICFVLLALITSCTSSPSSTQSRSDLGQTMVLISCVRQSGTDREIHQGSLICEESLNILWSYPWIKVSSPRPIHFHIMLKKGQVTGAKIWARNANICSKYPLGQKPKRKNTSGNQQRIITSTLLTFLLWKICALLYKKKGRFFNIYKKLIYEELYGRIKYSVAFVSQWLVLVMSVPPQCTAESVTLEYNFTFLKRATS